jgi:uncharacterized membrane protein YcjF (UPF0283 family)
MNQNNLENLQISELELLNESLEQTHTKVAFNHKSSTTKKAINMTIIVIISIITLLLINFSLDVYESYTSIANSSSFLAMLYLVIYFIAILGVSLYIIHSIKSYINLKDAFNIQKQTLNSTKYEDEKEISLSILKHYMQHQNQNIRIKAENLYKQVNTNSLHSPFISMKNEIIDDLDKEATTAVYSSAKEVSLFTAFSPGSALDSIVVIFSAMKLMKNIFLIYGYKTNFFTSLLIIRKILENASIAALVEYAEDSVNDLLGNTIISKLSTKMAQGIGNGVLMLRIGNILIQSARPFASDGSIGSYKSMVKLFVKYIKEKVGKKS